MLPTNSENSGDQLQEKSKGSVRVTTHQVTEHFSGPLPHPDIMEHYERIVPGSADRIIRKFESQTEHRQRMENRFVWAETIRSVGGLIGGFVIAITTIAGGLYMALHDHPFLGGSLSFVGLTVLVGAFLGNKLWQDKNDKD